MARRTNCIVCQSPLMPDIVQIGDQYPSAAYPKLHQNYGEMIKKSSLNVTQCRNEHCNLVQLSHQYDLELVFKHYPYTSGSTATMKTILQDIVDDAQRIRPVSEQDIVLDIGGNDGTMLSLMSDNLQMKVNIDAAQGIESVLTGDDYKKITGLFSGDTYKSLGLKNPKLIFSVAMFYHLEDPKKFCEDVRTIMDEDSVWCLQMTYLGSMLGDNIYDNIVHEHVTYYSLQSLEFLLKQCGLEVFHARVVESYGGSLRVFIQQAGTAKPRKKTDELLALRKAEESSQLGSSLRLSEFNERVQTLKITTRNWIQHIVDIQGPMHAIGASTKGNMICQFLEISKSEVSGVLDNSPKKIGSVLVGSDIPIVDETLYLQKISQTVLVLPYYYTDFFKKILKNTPAETLFVPLPYPRTMKLKG